MSFGVRIYDDGGTIVLDSSVDFTHKEAIYISSTITTNQTISIPAITDNSVITVAADESGANVIPSVVLDAATKTVDIDGGSNQFSITFLVWDYK